MLRNSLLFYVKHLANPVNYEKLHILTQIKIVGKNISFHVQTIGRIKFSLSEGFHNHFVHSSICK